MKIREIVECVGLITSQNTTLDVKPGEIKRQAAKLGFKVDPNGVPPKLPTPGRFPSK